MDKLLIDADVILDFFLNREPFSTFAAEVLTLCENKQVKGYTTPVIISNVYYLLKKTAKHKVIIENLKQLMIILDIAKMDKGIIMDALNSNFKDFEDALQNYSAIKNGSIQILLTRNLKDYKNSDLAILTPETYLKGRDDY